jgi:hypothetical protein
MEDCGLIGPIVWYAHGIYFTAMSWLSSPHGDGCRHLSLLEHEARIGRSRVREMLDLGIPVVSASRLVLERHIGPCSARRGRPCCFNASATDPGACPPRSLSMATEGGSRILGFEQAGRIEVGALADLALFGLMRLEYSGSLLDRRPRSCIAGTITGRITSSSTGNSSSNGEALRTGTSSGVGEEKSG